MDLLFSQMSFEIYKSIIQCHPDAIFILSVGGTVIEVNLMGTKILGYSQEEILGIHYHNILDPEYTKSVNQNFKQVVQGTPCEYETKAFHKSGEVVYLQVKNVPLLVNNEIVGVFCVAKDITDLQKKRASLTLMQEELNAFFNFTADAIEIMDLDGNIVYVNHAFEETYGWTREQVMGKPLPIISADHLAQRNSMVEQVLLGKHVKSFETTYIKKDGTTVEVSATFSPIQDAKDGVIGISGILRDITKQKQLEKLLKESEMRFRRVVENSPESIIVYQCGIIQYANPACVQLLGASSIADLVGKSITDYFHPESVKLIKKRIQELLQIGAFIAPVEEKVIRADGTVIDVEVTGITIDREGNPAFLMVYHDITTRKRAEEALYQSEQNYRLIAENMTDLVCVINWDGTFQYASPSHETVLGFSTEAYEGNPARDWMHKDDHPIVRNQLENTVKSKESCVFEFRFRDIKGNWIWLEGKATPVFDEEGHFKHFLVVSREITERKMFEEKLSFMAYHDPLTGLPNRRLFKERLEQAIIEAKRYGRKMAVMYMDMDKFKHINDTLGHNVGDKLLKQFSKRVKKYLRESDTLARQGGDEFIILLSEIQEEQDGVRIAKRILSSLHEPFQLGEHVIKISSSIGIAFYPPDGITRHELMNYADAALYEAKKDGRNNFKTYSLFQVK